MNHRNTTARRSNQRTRKTLDARDEMNIAEFPIALLTDRVPDGQNTLEFQDTIQDPGSGDLVQRKLTITAPDKYGLPTAADDEVILGLIQLTKLKNDFTDRTVHFSRYELIRLLGWPLKGSSYRRLEESLDRWVFVGLAYKRAWWDHTRKGWVDEKFHILERVSLFEKAREAARTDGQTVLPFSSFTWNEVLFQSFQSGYVKRLDLDFFLSLQSSTAKRMYRFLDKHFYRRPKLEYDLHSFAFEHIGLSRVYRTGVLKQKLAPAVKELETRGFLEPLSASERYVQVRRGEWQIVFLKKAPALPAPAKPPALQGLAGELAARGVTESTAAELVAAYAEERIRQKIDVWDWLTETKDKRLSSNPAGYLVKSIREDYQPPAGYELKEERERKQQAAAKARQRRQEQQDVKRRQEEQAEAQRRAERQHIDAVLRDLSPQERRALEERALANSSADMQAKAQGAGSIAGIARRLLVDQEVLRSYPVPATPEAGGRG